MRADVGFRLHVVGDDAPFGIEAENSVIKMGNWVIPVVRIEDRPRFAWRGAMLDVARHFFTVDDLKRYVDLVSLLKINRLHLHLSDDQGWRVEIKSWPNLTKHGGSTEVGGGPGELSARIKDELGATMNEHVAVYRDEEGLQTAHEVVRRLKEEADKAYVDDRGTVFNQDVLGAIELGYMLDLAACMQQAGVARKESRGVHLRPDYPERDDLAWRKDTVLETTGDDVV